MEGFTPRPDIDSRTGELGIMGNKSHIHFMFVEHAASTWFWYGGEREKNGVNGEWRRLIRWWWKLRMPGRWA